MTRELEALSDLFGSNSEIIAKVLDQLGITGIGDIQKITFRFIEKVQ